MMMSLNRKAFLPACSWACLCRLMLLGLLSMLAACQSFMQEESTGVSMTGIDHLADHVSVQDFWVNGHSGHQAGKGGRVVCCGIVPKKWRPGLTVRVQWHVTNWKERTWQSYEAQVPVDRYEETGRMFVHFLRDGSVRITLANESPRSPTYPGTREPIPQKEPWDVYPWPTDLNAK